MSTGANDFIQRESVRRGGLAPEQRKCARKRMSTLPCRPKDLDRVLLGPGCDAALADPGRRRLWWGAARGGQMPHQVAKSSANGRIHVMSGNLMTYPMLIN